MTGGSGREGGNDGGGGSQVKIPAAYVASLKEAGMWDDVKTRNKMFRKYLDGLKKYQPQGR